jgi:TPP-dependent pyruvate/acetoin dehydrogenase alpha subunit
MVLPKKSKLTAVKTGAVRDERWLRFYRQMLKIRLFEEEVNQLYLGAKMPGLAHLYIGEEAIAVGICESLHRDDYVTSTHRGHGHHVGDIARAYYRPKAEEQQWVSDRDPIKLHNDWLLKEGLVDAATLEKIGTQLTREMDAAVEFAVSAPYPDPSEVDQDIYA